MRQPGNLRVRQVSCTHAGGKLGRSCGSLVVGAAHQVFGACLILPQALQRSSRDMRAFLPALVYVVQKI